MWALQCPKVSRTPPRPAVSGGLRDGRDHSATTLVFPSNPGSPCPALFQPPGVRPGPATSPLKRSRFASDYSTPQKAPRDSGASFGEAGMRRHALCPAPCIPPIRAS